MRAAVHKWFAYVGKRIMDQEASICSGRLSETQYKEKCGERNELISARDELLKLIRAAEATEEDE